MSALAQVKSVGSALVHAFGRTVPDSLLERTILGRIRLMFFALIWVGALFAYLSWQSQKRIDDVLARGTVADARVTRTRVLGRDYLADIEWYDQAGAQERIEDFSVSPAFFNEIARRNPRH